MTLHEKTEQEFKDILNGAFQAVLETGHFETTSDDVLNYLKDQGYFIGKIFNCQEIKNEIHNIEDEVLAFNKDGDLLLVDYRRGPMDGGYLAIETGWYDRDDTRHQDLVSFMPLPPLPKKEEKE